MKSQWQIIEDILSLFSIVGSHCVEKGFLISEDIIVDKVVMHSMFAYFLTATPQLIHLQLF